MLETLDHCRIATTTHTTAQVLSGALIVFGDVRDGDEQNLLVGMVVVKVHLVHASYGIQGFVVRE